MANNIDELWQRYRELKQIQKELSKIRNSLKKELQTPKQLSNGDWLHIEKDTISEYVVKEHKRTRFVCTPLSELGNLVSETTSNNPTA